MTKELLPAQSHPALANPAQNPAVVYLARLGPRSRRVMGHALRSVAAIAVGQEQPPPTIAWWNLRYQHTQAIRVALAEKYPPATTNRTLSALRGVLKECWRLGYMDAEVYHRAVDIQSVRGQALPRGRALSVGEISALFAVCQLDHGISGVRDAALLAVLYAGGLRRTEAVDLNLADYNLTNGDITVRHGKGNKARLVHAPNGAKAALDDWVTIQGLDPGPLFYRIRKGGEILLQRLHGQAVRHVLRKRADQAGLEECSPHDLRRTFASHLLDAGADIVSVQALMGHSNVSTTARYDRRGERARRKASAMLHVPYRRQTG